MENIIVIYKNPEDTTKHCWLLPSLEYDLEWICKKDIPQGQPYCIVSQSSLPINYYNEMDCYDFNFSNIDGWGSGSTAPFNDVENLPSLFTITHQEWLQLKASGSL
jgi:hypothetical protein